MMWSRVIRASIISLGQLAIKIKIIYLCLVGGEREDDIRGAG
jgi:hypothetical protein